MRQALMKKIAGNIWNRCKKNHRKKKELKNTTE